MLANVPTYMCRRPDDLQYVLDHMDELVVKETHGAGGYGMLVGPAATRAEIDVFREVVRARPEQYIAQPTLALSTCPTYVSPASRRAISTCVPSCCRGARCAWCPAG